LPRDASRRVRSPVDAGSSEYSAVSQPRPFPYSQRGTPSWIDAVQSTFVFPWRTAPSRAAARGSREAARASAARRGDARRSGSRRRQRCELDVLDVRDRQLQEARAHLAERRGSPVVRKRYVPSRAVSFSYPLRASVSATSCAVSSAEKTSVTSRPNTRWKIGCISG
jgi:hypothetical protein